ncbi:aerobic carbon-monoxide dehydrogenase large subunit [Nocardioides zeae]|uniref:Aerobic carbon-monoxide dehydrogenase large subunit n=1 Tax=Nocardioides imazamoxiresistens TaxID=3231893 RepID=A0ABU3PXP4_9ACTN|nr:aerobic carbon-monoxide dehydrogenase large subunit [Nocardioides zeae]MDT9594011.1 aerobic carbon-monoxide dehydrogenase large subunit [Nocardioides zeae]
MSTSAFGEPVKRTEDPRLVTGKGRYVDDIGDDRTLHAAFVRSPHARARIRDIDPYDAYEVDGVVAVYTWDDLQGPAAEPLPLLIPHPDLTHPRTGYALARDQVNHVGEAIVMVVARDRYVAEDAAGLVKIDYEVLKPVVGLRKAAAGEELVYDDIPGNAAAVSTQAYGDAASQVADAPHRLQFEWDIERSACMPMEGKGVHARWDAHEEKLTLWTATQTSTGVRGAVSAKLGLDLTQVDVITPDVGGGFGVKIVHPWPEEIMVPWAAIRLGRDVKWTEDRREHFVSSAHERAQLLTVDVGFDDDGRVLGLEVDILHDHGAYIPYGLIVPINASTQLLGPYRPGAYRVTFTSLYTNTVLVTPYRGAGRPQGVYAMERTMDRIAQYLGKDRLDVRAANFIQPEDFPVDFGLMFQDGRPLRYDSGNYPALAEKLRALVGWDDFEKFRDEARAEGRQVGIGLGFYVEGTGPGPYEGGHVQVLTSGKVKVATGITSQGQGHQTAFAQIVATELGVPFEDVIVTTGDTRRFGYSVGTFASRGAVMSGSAIALAARKVRERTLRLAADALEADPGDLEIVDGMVQVKGDPSTAVGIGTVAVLSNPLRYAFDEASKAATQFSGGPVDYSQPPVAPGGKPGLDETDYYSPPYSTFAAGAHAVIVETDPDTAEITILKYAVVHDCGKMINPRIVEGQIHGGVAQGVGGALYEVMAYDEAGQLANASFMDFLMPYVSEVPTSIDIDHLETPSPLNPLGIKGAGEAGVIPTSAAIAAAIEDAEGIPIVRMPISPSELFDLRRAERPEPLVNTMPGTGSVRWVAPGSVPGALPTDSQTESEARA